jgi:hypothetical protein
MSSFADLIERRINATTGNEINWGGGGEGR